MSKALEDFAEEESQLDHLRLANARLSRELAKAKASRAETVHAVYQAASDAITGLKIPPVKLPSKDPRKKGAEVAIAVLSDWQLAKVTSTYNSDICEQRIDMYGDKVLELAEIQRRDHPVKELRCYLLGDLLEGELVFPGQPYAIDASLYQQVTVDGPRILANFLRKMATSFEKIHVVGVVGNHGIGGKSRKDYHPETNADSMLYEITKLTVKDVTSITWAQTVEPGQRLWYAIDTIGDHNYLLVHGDQVRGFAGIPWYGYSRKLSGWATGAIKEPFKYALTGHFHTPFREYLNGLTHWGNGSTESHNAYAAEQMAASGEPCQWLLFAHPKRGVTAEYLVHLDEE